MQPSTRAAVEEHVGRVLGLDVDDLRRPGLVVRPSSTADERVDLFRVGDTCVVQVPADRVADVERRTGGRSVDEVFTAPFAASLGEPDMVVLGPSLHSYVDRSSFLGVPDARVERVGADDARLLALRDATAPEEWSEGGFAHSPALAELSAAPLYGLVEGDALVAAGNMTPFRDAPGDVGLVTHRDQRGHGLGRAVAATMTAEWLPVVDIVRYRALATNTASLAIAARLGFEAHGANIVVRRR